MAGGASVKTFDSIRSARPRRLVVFAEHRIEHQHAEPGHDQQRGDGGEDIGVHTPSIGKRRMLVDTHLGRELPGPQCIFLAQAAWHVA